jgi:hypothetical protein
MSLRGSAAGPAAFLPPMWFPDLSAKDLDSSTALILLSWDELFGESTPDTYKAKLHDTLSLAVELGEVASQAAKDHRWTSHLPHVIEELHFEAESDPILTRHYPHIKNGIAELKKEATQSQASRLANIVQFELSDYQNKVKDYFLESLQGLPQKKEIALAAIRKLATRAVQEGLTPGECRAILDESLFGINPVQAGEELNRCLGRRPQQWLCIFAIKGAENEIDKLLKWTKFKRLPNKRKPLGKTWKKFSEQAPDVYLAFTEIDSDRLADVVQIALRELRLVLDVANFNYRSAPFQLIPIIYASAKDEHHIVNVTDNPYGGLEPQGNATDWAARLQKDGVIASLPERIITALEQHSVAHASTDPKVRFVNIWVALETIVGHDRENGIVENLIRGIIPPVVHRRVNKVIKYLAICLHEFGFCNTIPDNTKWFKRSTDYKVMADELLLVLCGRAGKEVEDELARITLSHPLLCNKLFEVHKIVKDPAELFKEMKKSRKRIEWQLRRIYRARNLLVHAGSPVTSLPYLGANLEYYFSITLSRILHDFHRYKDWSIDRSFEHRRIQFEYLMKKLEQGPSVITSGQFLEDSKSPLENALLWPKAETK